MDSSTLQNRRDYKRTTARPIALLEADPGPGSREEAELEMFIAAVQRYETRRVPIEPPTPEEAIRFRLEQMRIGSL
jgi:HTH-type transcriptional regulator/antitoxin HigA